MKVSLNWVGELLAGDEATTLRERADEVASRLTFVGLELEHVAHLGAGLGDIVVARVAAVAAHPRADRLSVVQVEAGHERLQVVSGATNFKAGDLVPLARAGTKLPGGKLIEAAELRGVASQGMLCSESELGLTEEHGGIWILPAGLVPGASVADALPLSDVVLDLNVTHNRGDCLSHLGIARELSALFRIPLAPPPPHLEPAAVDGLSGFDPPPAPRIQRPDRCGRYEGQLIVGRERLGGVSPFLWRYRLSSCGVRPIGIAVDATNYVLLELGQPLHAFDRAKLRAGITVRLARQGEKLVTLDGVSRELQPTDLCICDGEQGERPVALAGVMGGAETAVGEGTQAIYLESAQFSGRGIRQTARRLAIDSDAAFRFARGVDPQLPTRARQRAVALLAEVGAQAGPWAAADGTPTPRPRVKLHFRRVEQLLGEEISARESRDCLERLQIPTDGPVDEVQGTYVIPTHRLDLESDVDLVGEIARLRGFDRLPSRAPLKAPEPVPRDPRLAALARLRETLRGQGFAETLHLGFLHDPIFEGFGAGQPVRVVNPLAVEASAMRRSLLPSLLTTVRRNLAHLTQDAGAMPPLRLFEIARTYHWPAPGERGEGPALEPLTLGLVLSGGRQPLGWATDRAEVDFPDLCGVVERLTGALRVAAELRRVDHATLHPRSASGLFVGKQSVGLLGELHPALAEAAGLPRGLLIAELDLEGLLLAAEPFVFRPVPRFPAVLRDVALVVEESVPAATLDAVLRRAGGPLLEAVNCFDVYRGPPLQKTHKSLAYSLRFRATDRTLTDEEVSAIHRAMVEAAAAEVGATLR